jgi:hypothetical protein
MVLEKHLRMQRETGVSPSLFRALSAVINHTKTVRLDTTVKQKAYDTGEGGKRKEKKGKKEKKEEKERQHHRRMAVELTNLADTLERLPSQYHI